MFALRALIKDHSPVEFQVTAGILLKPSNLAASQGSPVPSPKFKRFPEDPTAGRLRFPPAAMRAPCLSSTVPFKSSQISVFVAFLEAKGQPQLLPNPKRGPCRPAGWHGPVRELLWEILPVHAGLRKGPWPPPRTSPDTALPQHRQRTGPQRAPGPARPLTAQIVGPLVQHPLHGARGHSAHARRPPHCPRPQEARSTGSRAITRRGPDAHSRRPGPVWGRPVRLTSSARGRGHCGGLGARSPVSRWARAAKPGTLFTRRHGLEPYVDRRGSRSPRSAATELPVAGGATAHYLNPRPPGPGRAHACPVRRSRAPSQNPLRDFAAAAAGRTLWARHAGKLSPETRTGD